MQLLAVLALACMPGFPQWKWDRLPETDIVDYRIEVAYLDPNFYPCTTTVCDENGANCHDVSSRCVAYSLSAWSLASTEPQPPASEPTVCADWDSGDPPLGLTPPLDAVVFINVRGRDAAGNVGN